MYRHRFSNLLFRPLSIGSLAIAGLWLSGCADSGPSAPSDSRTTPDFAFSGSTTEVEIREDFGRLKWDGSVRIYLRARCPAGFHVLEGPVTLTQTPETQEVFAEAWFSTTCDGLWRRVSLRVIPTEGRFRVGRAQLSVALMVETEDGDFQQGQDSQVIRIIR
jgi:hypothetical protein